MRDQCNEAEVLAKVWNLEANFVPGSNHFCSQIVQQLIFSESQNFPDTFLLCSKKIRQGPSCEETNIKVIDLITVSC